MWTVGQQNWELTWYYFHLFIFFTQAKSSFVISYSYCEGIESVESVFPNVYLQLEGLSVTRACHLPSGETWSNADLSYIKNRTLKPYLSKKHSYNSNFRTFGLHLLPTVQISQRHNL